VFATKPEPGRQIADLHAEGHLPPWVTGDEQITISDCRIRGHAHSIAESQSILEKALEAS
jgi:hypothetical protein